MLKRIALIFTAILTIVASFSFIQNGSVDSNPEMEIYLVSNEIHTDFLVPVRNHVFDWETFFFPQDFKSRPSEWIEIGWGDRQFYFEVPTWDQFTLKLALDALFAPGPSVMHVNYRDMSLWDERDARKIRISYKTYKKLVESIKSDFILENGRPVLVSGKSYSLSDNFYEANDPFSVFRTCNVWTSDKLKDVELKHPLWSPTKYGLEFLWQHE